MAHQIYKVVNTHACEISVWKFLSRLILARAPNIWGVNGDVQYDLANLVFKNGE